MNRIWPAAAVLAMMLAACQPNHQAKADPIESPADQPFVLHGGQEATISGQDLKVRFDQVLEDSRCPTDVQCVWTGQARIVVSVQRDDSDPTKVEFNTNPAPGQIRRSALVGAYTLELQSLEPNRRTTDEEIAFEDYAATLVVRTP